MKYAAGVGMHVDMTA